MTGKCVFFGTPLWAVPSLDALARSDWTILGVVTNPDRPAGRGYELQASPVKQRAMELGIETRQPGKARDPELQAWLEHLAPDAAVVVAYGKILPGSLLEVPKLGFLNVHFSLLPEYRGAAPVQRAIADGREETGVTIIVLTEGMDEGPILAAEPLRIDPDETAGGLGLRLAEIGARVLLPALDAYLEGRIEPQEQEHERATYAPKLASEDAAIVWTRSSASIKNLVRALNPAPGAWTTFRDNRFKLHRVSILEGGHQDVDLAPGHIAAVDGLWLVGTGDGLLVIEEGQVSGKRKTSGRELARGLRPLPGESFG